MNPFPRPSELFRWALNEFESGDATFKLAECFPQYYSQKDADSYLWRQYDRRLRSLVHRARPGRRVLEIGSGFGIDAVWAALAGAAVTAVDVKSQFIEIANRLKAQVELRFGISLNVVFRRANLLDLEDGMEPVAQ